MQVNPESTKNDIPVFVPRDKRFIVRALSPAQKLLQTRRRNACRCSVCRSPDIAQVADGANLWHCHRCHTVLRMDCNRQCTRTRLTIQQALAKVAQQAGGKQRNSRKKTATEAQPV